MVPMFMSMTRKAVQRLIFTFLRTNGKQFHLPTVSSSVCSLCCVILVPAFPVTVLLLILQGSHTRLSKFALLQGDWDKFSDDVRNGYPNLHPTRLVISSSVADALPHNFKAKPLRMLPIVPWTYRQSIALMWKGAGKPRGLSSIPSRLISRLGLWSKPWMNVLPSTWDFCLKEFPDGLVKKYKAWFCNVVICSKKVLTILKHLYNDPWCGLMWYLQLSSISYLLVISCMAKKIYYVVNT